MSKDAGVEKFYRMMDAVTDDGVQAACIRSNVGTAWGKVNGALFDVTTLSFASENSDELRKKGYRTATKGSGSVDSNQRRASSGL